MVGVQTVEHVKAMPDALRIKLSQEELDTIYEASPFDPLFPMDFLLILDVIRSIISLSRLQTSSSTKWLPGLTHHRSSW
jgi:hypothetical protein